MIFSPTALSAPAHLFVPTRTTCPAPRPAPGPRAGALASWRDRVTAARQRNGDLKVLFLSGYSDSAVLESAVGDALLLRKPFRPADLATAVRHALDA
jgi:hypothetical protein